MIKASITAIGGHVPDFVMTNDELAKFVDTNDEWITSRTGIKERRVLNEPGKATSDMMVIAIEELLKKRGISASEIDLLIVGTITGDYIFPSTANIICDKIGAKNAWGYDLAAACSGFIFGLATGSQFIETGRYKKVIVAGVDKMSTILNYEDRTTCVIFGDGGGAVLLEPTEDGLGIQDFILKSDGAGRNFLFQPAGGSLNPPTHDTIDKRMHYVHQEGQAVFKNAVVNMAEISAEIMSKNNLNPEDIAWLAPHQANKRICEATANRMGLNPDKMLMNIERYGNTTAGTIPLLLWDYEKKFKKGDNIILSAFGGGFTWGSVWIKWSYDGSKIGK
ncbi:MAG: beta-ketoacyl-ACP synthase III [Bacteroidota bacterium]